MLKLKVSILSFGAVADTDTLQTEAIQRAIDFCFERGGGEVIIPSGTFRTGDIRIRSNITLHLLSGSRLLGSRDPMDYFRHRCDTVEPLAPSDITDAPYVHLSTINGETQYEENKPEYRFKRLPASRWNNALIRAIDVENIAIIGDEDAVIDGDNCFDSQGEELYRGPHGMTLFRCRGVCLSGYTIQNTGNWAHNLLFCENITVRNIRALAGHDGFDVAVCENVKIIDSEFYTGDDCVAGFGNTNVLVENCVLNSSCSAFRFGGTNVIICSCRLIGPGRYGFRGAMPYEEKAAGASSPLKSRRNNMLSAFTYYADYSLPISRLPGNIIMERCYIENADRFLHYNYSGNETWQKNRPLTSICFRDIKATGIAMPMTAYGDTQQKISIIMNRVSIDFRENAGKNPLLRLCNYDTVRLHDVQVKNAAGEALIRTWSDGYIDLKNVIHDAENDIVSAAEPFTCGAI